MNWIPGLDDASAVGGFGFYRARERAETHALPCCHWNGAVFAAYGSAQGFFAPELPDAYQWDIHGRSWTGLTADCRWADGTLRMDVRTTLPGPRFTPGGRTFHLRWMQGCDIRSVALPGGRSLDGKFDHVLDGTGLMVARGGKRSFLLATSGSMVALRTVAERHWQIDFAAAGSPLLVVPLPPDFDPERVFVHEAIWREMAGRPPLSCAESHAAEGGRIHLRQHFAGAAWSPLPPFFSLWGGKGGLLKLPESVELMPTVFGPWRVVEGEAWQAVVEAGWMKARLEIPHLAEGPLEPLPRELHYAGDWTWDESTVLDRLLSLRTWAPLVGALPEPRREELLERLRVPTAEAFLAKQCRTREPVTGRVWARDQDAWRERGEAIYDPDWYIGLSLSGLWRATRCADPAIATSARALADGVRGARAEMAAYFEIFHDWMLGCAWSDPRGGLWLPDCAHNGMEGMLGEANLREAEGDDAGAARLRVLAAKSAVAFLAVTAWAEWLRTHEPAFLHQFEPGDNPFLEAPHDERLFGINSVFVPHFAFPSTAAVRNPYQLAGHFPEYAALFKAHGPVDDLRRLAAIWQAEFPERCRDWMIYYIKSDWRERFVRERDQEAREQAAVFYHLAPEVCSRLWILGESAESIEARYATPLNLAEQVLLRCGSGLGGGG